MNIADLSYLEVAQADVNGGYYFGPSSTTHVNAVIKETLDIKKNLVSTVLVKGNFAGAEADAVAYGKNTSTQAISATFVDQGKASMSTATSVSATSGFFYKKS
ncbi:MAG: hypothetical protein SNJ57_14410 [Cyanobacteriota bacterium]